jgi:ABC-type branched-chain amino acid transport systems, periplasmic component
LPLRIACGMIAATEIEAAGECGTFAREAAMNRALSGGFASVLVLAATAAMAQSKPPLKLGGILDMSGLYADITGAGSETAAKMAAEDFGGEVLGRKIEIIAADHLNKADLAANIARDMLDNQGVEMIFDVAASATALAAEEIAKTRNKIIMFNGPGSIRLSNEACGPYTVHYVFDTFAQANVTGLAAVKQGLDSWFFLTADYAFGQDLEKDTTNVVLKSGGKVLGSVRHPLNTSDFSSYLLQAQSLEGQGDRACQCRRRHHQRDQAGRRVRADQERPEAVAVAGLRHRYRQRRS